MSNYMPIAGYRVEDENPNAATTFILVQDRADAQQFEASEPLVLLSDALAFNSEAIAALESLTPLLESFAESGFHPRCLAMVRRATQAVPDADNAWSRLRASNAALLKALERIEAIPNDVHSGDWDEIELARGIASHAIVAATGTNT